MITSVIAQPDEFGFYTPVLTTVYDDNPLAKAEAEVERLTEWLERICGGDTPCHDESQLRGWAYDAVTLGRRV